MHVIFFNFEWKYFYQCSCSITWHAQQGDSVNFKVGYTEKPIVSSDSASFVASHISVSYIDNHRQKYDFLSNKTDDCCPILRSLWAQFGSVWSLSVPNSADMFPWGKKTLYQSHLQFFDSTTVAFIYSQFKNICLFHIFHFFLTPHEEKV